MRSQMSPFVFRHAHSYPLLRMPMRMCEFGYKDK